MTTADRKRIFLYYENHISRPKDTIHYRNNEVTVIWKPKVCIHSTICWKGLIQIFNAGESTWIKWDRAAAEKINEQVRNGLVVLSVIFKYR